MNMKLNPNLPWFWYLTEQNQIDMWDNIKSSLRNKSAKYLFNETEDVMLRRLGRYFHASILSLVESGNGAASVKTIYKKIIEYFYRAMNAQLSLSSLTIIENEIDWMNNNFINLNHVFNLFNAVRDNTKEQLEGEEREDKDSFILLNSMTQVVFFGCSTLFEHAILTVVFGFNFYAYFMDLYEKVITNDFGDCIEFLIDTKINKEDVQPVFDEDSQTISILTVLGLRGQVTRRRIPPEAKVFMDKLFDQKDGNVTQEHHKTIAAVFPVNLRSVSVYYKNKRARIRRMAKKAAESESIESHFQH
uniref:Homeobox domain-containing protein n=1 Tax=Caenorhabditis tropicalis TaxID=1561998 RepID=A0A1I7U9C3_9PELO